MICNFFIPGLKKVNMKFNSDKFECVRYWADYSEAPTFDYLGPDKSPIEVKSNLRDLGVIVSISGDVCLDTA